MVFQLNVKDLRVAKWFLSAMADRGAAADRLWPVANRAGQKHAMATVADAKKLLGMEVTEVRNDYRAAIQSVNYGMLLSEAAPRSPLTRATEEMARRVIDAASRSAK